MSVKKMIDELRYVQHVQLRKSSDPITFGDLVLILRAGLEAEKPSKKTPSLEDVKAYCHQRRNSVDPDKFWNFYEANGWVQGKNKPIKNWQAAVRIWERGSFDQSTQNKSNQSMFDQDEGKL